MLVPEIYKLIQDFFLELVILFLQTKRDFVSVTSSIAKHNSGRPIEFANARALARVITPRFANLSRDSGIFLPAASHNDDAEFTLDRACSAVSCKVVSNRVHGANVEASPQIVLPRCSRRSLIPDGMRPINLLRCNKTQFYITRTLRMKHNTRNKKAALG